MVRLRMRSVMVVPSIFGRERNILVRVFYLPATTITRRRGGKGICGSRDVTRS